MMHVARIIAAAVATAVAPTVSAAITHRATGPRAVIPA